MDGLSDETLRLALVFVIPGFIASRVYRLFTPGPPANASEQLYEAISYGMINLAFVFWLPLLVWTDKYVDDNPVLFAVTGLLALVVSPALLGWAAARGRRAKWMLKYVSHPAACAWDYFFEQRRSCFVIVTLQDGTLVAGYWGPNSFASSSPHTGDIYLEQVWRLTDGSLTGPIPGSLGCHIRASDWKLLQFIEAREGKDERQGQFEREDITAKRDREARLSTKPGAT
jgi:hypothetical protein